MKTNIWFLVFDDQLKLFFLVRLNGKYFGSGFTHVPGGEAYRDRSVLSYHYYCIFLSLDPVPGNATIPDFERVICDDIEGPSVFESVRVRIIKVHYCTEFANYNVMMTVLNISPGLNFTGDT